MEYQVSVSAARGFEDVLAAYPEMKSAVAEAGIAFVELPLPSIDLGKLRGADPIQEPAKKPAPKM